MAKTAIEVFREREADPDSDLKNESPLERLRFFCSMTMGGQDWLDAEQFFNELVLEREASRRNMEQICDGLVAVSALAKELLAANQAVNKDVNQGETNDQ